MRTRRGFLVAACTVLALAACAGDDGSPQADGPEQAGQAEPGEHDGPGATETGTLAPMPPFDTGEVVLAGPGGERVTMAVYVADDADTRRQGLMGVTDLPRDAGMVFLYTEDSSGAFWMKNTLIALSIAFFDADGAVVAVLDMEPCQADPCPTYDPEVTYRGALEVNQGSFDDVGLDERWQVQVEPEAGG